MGNDQGERENEEWEQNLTWPPSPISDFITHSLFRSHFITLSWFCVLVTSIILTNLMSLVKFLFIMYLLETAYSRVSHYYWIGLSYSANDSVWKWADGTIWDGYQNWFRDNQRNFTHWSPCTVMHIIKWPSYYYAKWYLRSCSTRHGYICEKP